MNKKEPEADFSKQQFLNSKNFTAGQKDILNALLEEGKTYTHSQVNEAVKKFLDKEAK